MNARTYTTLKGAEIPLDGLATDERRLLHTILTVAHKAPDWIDYGNFWPSKVLDLYGPKGLSRKRIMATPLYRIAQDLGSRLAIEQGYARMPDYRDMLAALIRDKFGTQRAFCKATGLSEDLVSHVLAGRKHLAIDNLTRALARIGYRLAIVPDQTAAKKKAKSVG